MLLVRGDTTPSPGCRSWNSAITASARDRYLDQNADIPCRMAEAPKA